MMKNKRFINVISIALLLVVLMTGCGGGNKNEGTNNVERTDENTLVIAQDRDATSLDPHGSNDEASNRLRIQIFSTLVTYTEDRELVGDLAEDWTYEDDKTIVFKIKDGVKFHNGDDLTPEDIKFSLDRGRESSVVSHILEDVKEVNIRENGDIEILTYEPSATIMSKLANPCSSIMSEAAVKEAGEEFGQNPMGTGPFKFVNWQAGDNILLEKNHEYFGEQGKMEFLEFVIIPEGNNRTIALETGEIDIAYEIDPVNISILEENEDLEYIVDDSFTVHYMGFNTQKAPFDDVRVRQAIAYGVYVDEILETVLYNTVKKADALLNDNVIGSGGEYENYPYNPEKAKQLLAEAGYPDGLDIQMLISDSNIRERNSEMMQAQLKDIGVNMSIEMLEWGSFVEKAGQGDSQVFLLAATVSTGDADDPFSLLLHSEQMGDAGNRAFYSNPRVDELIEKGRMELEESKRVEIYNELQSIINEEVPLYPLYYNTQNAGINKKVKGFKLNPAGYHILKNAYLEE